MSDFGTLYIIATPIGNLADITLRALDIIKNVEILYAEDTRVTKHLLEHYGIQAALQSLHDFNESKKISSVIDKLQAGADLGLVSDAGTPLISDPGYKLVSAAKEAGIDVRSIPGASALTAALSVAGIPTDRFIFEGFLPKSSSERVKLLNTIRFETRTIVFYESAQRIQASIQDCINVLGGERKAAILRELTKHYEQHIHAELTQIQQQLDSQSEKIRGEIVLVLHGDVSSEDAENFEKARQLLLDLQQHLPLKEAASIVAKHSGIRRNRLYSLGLEGKCRDE
ncbi:MAG: 16S rRNA (cytidine(1402)-2'-O)-methyltransferase [Gammaproteobacteria bacterium]